MFFLSTKFSSEGGWGENFKIVAFMGEGGSEVTYNAQREGSIRQALLYRVNIFEKHGTTSETYICTVVGCIQLIFFIREGADFFKLFMSS